MNKFIKSPLQRDPALNKKLKVAGQLLILIILVSILVLPYFVFAQDPLQKLQDVAGAGGYETSDTGDETRLAGILGLVVRGFLSLLGIIFIILIIVGGQKWMTATGNEEKVSKAKDILWRAIIGLIIVVGSYAIWIFVAKAIFNV